MQRTKTKDVIRKAKADHESSIISDLKFNPKRLHKYIRQRQKVKHTIGPLKQADGTVTKTNKESAEALACSLSQSLSTKTFRSSLSSVIACLHL